MLVTVADCSIVEIEETVATVVSVMICVASEETNSPVSSRSQALLHSYSTYQLAQP